jgi:hypothetical protein
MTIPYTNEDDDIANDEKEHLQKSEGQIPTRNVKPYKNENVADCKVENKIKVRYIKLQQRKNHRR